MYTIILLGFVTLFSNGYELHRYSQQINWHIHHHLLVQMMVTWHWNICRITGPLRGESTTKGFDAFFVVDLYKPWNKEANCQWFEIPWSSCDVTVMRYWLATYLTPSHYLNQCSLNHTPTWVFFLLLPTSFHDHPCQLCLIKHTSSSQLSLFPLL